MENSLQIEITDALQDELSAIDDAKLPEILNARIGILEKINKQFEEAQNKKIQAQKRMEVALNDADSMIRRAEKLGELDPETHKIFNIEFSTKGDRITALENCLMELAKYGSETAKYQKQLAEVQNAALISQTAVMDVQKCQMEYLECTSKAMKFLYGLSAFGISSTQSIVTNLELILSGAKKKDLGEMAKQQLYLVMDQIKSQENLQNRIIKDESKIDNLQDELRQQAEKDEERFKQGDAKDKQQDDQLKEQILKDTEHDKAIAFSVKKDEEHDFAIQSHEDRLNKGDKKDFEQDRAISYIYETDKKQNMQLLTQKKKDEEHDNAIIELSQMIQDLSDDYEEFRAEISRRTDSRMIYLAIGLSAVSLLAAIIGFFI